MHVLKDTIMIYWDIWLHFQIAPKSFVALSIKTILATRNTQRLIGQEQALVMQTTHAQRWQYPDVSTRVCFLPLKMYTGITKILEFEYKTCMF